MRIGGYEVERELARGGMGVVYLARDPQGERVAVKVILAGGVGDPELLARFRREAEALAVLEHPGILRVLGHGVERGRPYTIMDYLDGPTLAEWVEAEGPPAEFEVARIGAGLADALAHAHARGVLHRDLKPENVILHEGEPVLVDFGLVLALGFDRSRLTESGTILGSLNFMAPEQARGEKDLQPAVDVYGLGATLYTLLCGAPPFAGGTALEVLTRVASQPPRPLRAIRPGVSPELEAIVLRCLEKDPAQRFPSAGVAGQALRAATVSARPPPLARSWRGLTLAGALAAIATLVSGLAWGDDDERYRALLREGAALYQTGDHVQALATLDGAVELLPAEASAYAQRALNLAELGRQPEALAECARALERDPVCADAVRVRAGVYVDLERYEEAIAGYTRLLELEPGQAQAHFQRAQCAAALGRVEKALADCTRAFKLDPNLLDALESRALFNWRLGHEAKAVADAGRVLARDPDRPRSLTVLALHASQQGQSDEALTKLDRALELDPEDPETHLGRAIVLQGLGRHTEALHHLDTAVALIPPHQAGFALVARGRARAKAGLTLEALSDVDAAIALEPREPEHHAVRGMILSELQRLFEALKAYDRAFELGPRRAYTQRNYAGVLVQLRRYDEAIEAFDRALSLEQDANAFGYRGFCKAALERYAEAIKDFDRALVLQEDGPRAELYRRWREAAVKFSGQ